MAHLSTVKRAATMAMAVMAVMMVAASPSSGALIGLSSDGAKGALYSIDSATGAATKLTDISNGTSLVGLEYMNGKLYATDVFVGGFTFGTIDITTGAYTVINNQAGSANWHGLAGDPAAGLLYTIDINNDNKLTSIDPLSNVITVIGGGNAGIDGRGMAYDPIHGILYATGGENLYTVNTTTGVATLVGGLGVSTGLFGMAYDPLAQVLYGNSGNSDALYSINVATGLASLIGSNGVAASVSIDGLADMPTAVPEPASLMLIGAGLGALGVAARRRRK